MQKLFTSLLIVLIIKIAQSQKLNEKCITQENIQGECIPLNSCDSLYKLVSKDVITEDVRIALNSSQCAQIKNQVIICCPIRSGQRSFLPDVGLCGVNALDKIVGGVNTSLTEFPWMALLEYVNPFTNEKGLNCGGSLINDKYVLTAAHCVSNLPPHLILTGVRLGEHDIRTNPDCDAQICADSYIDSKIGEVIYHEKYDTMIKNLAYDIALIRLDQPVKLSEFVSPVCLPRTQELKLRDLEGYSFYAAGWGKTEGESYSEVKLKVEIPGISLEKCKRIYSKRNLNDNQMCAGGISGQDSCQGDSGGPLVGLDLDLTKNQIYYYLAGIVSYGPLRCGREGSPGIYTRVSSHIEWIESKLRQ